MSDVFHLNLTKAQLKGATLAIVPGDPARSERIAKKLDNPEFLASTREFTSWLGYLNGQPVVVCSTGIGGPSTSICVEELAQLGVRTFLRIGTTGAIQPHINVGDILVTTGSVRLDGASRHFAPIEYPAVANFECTTALYNAAKEKGIEPFVGITASSDTFYPGQERYDTYSGKVYRDYQGLLKQWQDLNVMNYEMESATLFTMCNALGLRAGMVAGVIVNRTQQEIPNEATMKDTEDKAVSVVVEAARKLFKTSVKTPSFITAPEEMPNFGKISLMKNQEGIYLAYLTDPAAIAKVLPAPLKPFSVPVVTVSVCHVKEPTFADDYYEAILGVYCTYGTQLGLYPIGLVLGGTGAEMAVQCGRDNGSIPKKLGSEFVIRRNNDHVTAQVCRRGTELVNIDLKIGEYNNAMTGMLYQFPEAGKKTYGGGFYFHLDREPDKEGKSHFQNGALLQNLCEYNYHSWEPGFAAIKLQSSIDDPWGELPIRTVIGGAYSSNDLMVHKLNLCEEIDADVLAPYLLTARYDRTAFMETGRR